MNEGNPVQTSSSVAAVVAVTAHAALTTGVHGITAAGAALIDDATAADQRTTLGLGTAATQASTAFEASGAVSTHAAITTGVHGITAAGAALIDDADAAAQRATLDVPGLNTSNTLTGTQTIQAAATQDAIKIAGGAGGTSSFAVTITPLALSANRSRSEPDEDGTYALRGANTFSGTQTVPRNSATILGDGGTWQGLRFFPNGETYLDSDDALYLRTNGATSFYTSAKFTNSSINLYTTVTVSSTTEATDKDTGSIVTEGGIGVEKSVFAGLDLIALGRIRCGTLTPASASATGVAGSIAWDSNYIYICTATDTWKRVAIATW